MKDIVDISHHSSRTVDHYYFDVILDAEEVTFVGGEVTIEGDEYTGTLTVRGGKYERDEEITILFDDNDLDDELLEKLEKLVLDQFYRMDTNNN
jgi:hypothetical protein